MITPPVESPLLGTIERVEKMEEIESEPIGGLFVHPSRSGLVEWSPEPQRHRARSPRRRREASPASSRDAFSPPAQGAGHTQYTPSNISPPPHRGGKIASSAPPPPLAPPKRRSSIIKDDEKLRPPINRRVTFSAIEETHLISSPPTQETFPLGHGPPPPIRHVSIAMGETPPTAQKRPRSPETTSRSTKRYRTDSSMSDVINVRGSSVFHRLSPQSTVLLTNNYDGWSNYSMALGDDGHLELLDNTARKPLTKALIMAERYTASRALNGAWIAPGTLALTHKEPAKWPHTQITVVEYPDLQLTKAPQVYHVPASPHKEGVRLSAITALWHRDDRYRAFATGCIPRR